MSLARDIRHAITTLIVKDTAVVPKTPLVTAQAGSLTATVVPLLEPVSGRSRFVARGRAGFYDDQGEGLLTIDSVSADGTTITFAESSGTGFTGLAHTHTPGNGVGQTPYVYTNILPYRPGTAAQNMLEMGDPVVWVTVRGYAWGTNGATMPQGYFPVYDVVVQVNRSLNTPDTTHDPESWTQQCQEATDADLEAICAVLLAHQDLATDFSPALSLQFAPLGGGGEMIAVSAGEMPADARDDQGGWHWAGTARLVLVATGQSFA